MSEVQAATEQSIPRPADQVYAELADYRTIRPQILPDNYFDYTVQEGGQGAGTQVQWKLQATKSRVRDCAITVSEPDERTIVETDTNSSMVTTWTVTAQGDQSSTVNVRTTWQGAGGIAGFFEGIFAPLGLRRIQAATLEKLANYAGTN